MDSIGLGGVLANAVVIVGLAVSFSIFFLFRKVDKKGISLIWLSCSLNLISFLYFMGTTSSGIIVLNVFIWPALNFLGLVYGAIMFFRKKK